MVYSNRVYYYFEYSNRVYCLYITHTILEKFTGPYFLAKPHRLPMGPFQKSMVLLNNNTKNRLKLSIMLDGDGSCILFCIL